MTRAACAALCSILVGCASVESGDTREYLDSRTAATVTVASTPWVFSRERPDVAVNLRDYLTLYSVEVNRSGERRTYLVAHAWSTVSARPELPDADFKLDIAADDRSFSMQPTTTEPIALGIGDPIVSTRSRSERVWYFPVDREAPAYISAARSVTATLHARNSQARYEIWRRAAARNTR